MSKKRNFPVTIAFRIDRRDNEKLNRVARKLEVSKSEFLRRYLITQVINFEL